MISIIIPVYNVSKYIYACLESVSQQTYTNIECLLIDDCGTDNSISIAQDFIDNYKGNVLFRIIHHEVNKGLSAARNTGVREANGEFVLFIDSDDWITKDTCEILLSHMNIGKDVGIVSCSCYVYEEDGTIHSLSKNFDFNEIRQILPEDYADRMLMMKSQHTAWGKLFKKEIVLSVPFREGLNNEDILFCLDSFPYVEKNNIRTIEIPNKLFYYRMRSGSICHAYGNRFIYDEFVNQEIVINECKNSKPHIAEEYRKLYIRRMILVLDYAVFKWCIFHNKFWEIIKKARKTENQKAKNYLSKKDYRVFLLYKYIPLVMLIRRNYL